jgi:hypothetical protein
MGPGRTKERLRSALGVVVAITLISAAGVREENAATRAIEQRSSTCVCFMVRNVLSD